jgi:hypothetical protein
VWRGVCGGVRVQDFQGQKLSELLYQWIVCLFGLAGFGAGFVFSSFSLMMSIFGAGVLFSIVVRSPPFLPGRRAPGPKRRLPAPCLRWDGAWLVVCVCTVPQGAQLRAAGRRRGGGVTHVHAPTLS